MSTTFADFTAQQEARESISASVLKHTLSLCEALRQNYIDYSIKMHQSALNRLEGHTETGVNYHIRKIFELREGTCDYEFTIESGRKYHKIILNANGSRSVHAFVDKKTGELYKSASFKAPAKGARYDLRIIEQREWLFQHADWAGAYLYAK